ncbi:hypothetical protein ACFLZ1_02625 [Patescibacteria group bacterium]
MVERLELHSSEIIPDNQDFERTPLRYRVFGGCSVEGCVIVGASLSFFAGLAAIIIELAG